MASCADVARTRGEAISASAAPYRRHFVVEMPGSWGCSPLDERQLAPVPRDNTRATEDASLNVLRIRCRECTHLT